jgi:hypothetical protein
LGKPKDWEPWLVAVRFVSGYTLLSDKVQSARYVCVVKTKSGMVVSRSNHVAFSNRSKVISIFGLTTTVGNYDALPARLAHL